MKKIYAEEPKILVCSLDTDVVTASATYGDDNIGYWGRSWFSSNVWEQNGGDNNG